MVQSQRKKNCHHSRTLPFLNRNMHTHVFTGFWHSERIVCHLCTTRERAAQILPMHTWMNASELVANTVRLTNSRQGAQPSKMVVFPQLYYSDQAEMHQAISHAPGTNAAKWQKIRKKNQAEQSCFALCYWGPIINPCAPKRSLTPSPFPDSTEKKAA